MCQTFNGKDTHQALKPVHERMVSIKQLKHNRVGSRLQTSSIQSTDLMNPWLCLYLAEISELAPNQQRHRDSCSLKAVQSHVSNAGLKLY